MAELFDEDARKITELAIGRILRLGSRPTQQGDIAEYERCRSLILDNSESLEGNGQNWTRDNESSPARAVLSGGQTRRPL